MSTLSSPATSTLFIDGSAAVDGEAPDHAVDDAIRGGGVGVEALVQAAEEREELADHHVEEHQVFVGEAVAALHDHVFRPGGHSGRDAAPHDQLARPELFAVQLA